MWSRDELDRYARQMVLPELGPRGQARLKQASVLVVGAGGLGAPLLLYLAAAGVGRLGIVDSDRVELSNLQRQILYRAQDLGRLKVEAAREALLALNPLISIEPYPERLLAPRAAELVGAYDVVVDASDNFPTRYLLNQACAERDRPLVYGAVYRFEGQVALFRPRQGPCYACLYPEPPSEGPNCAEAGVLGAVVGVVGSWMAVEVLKLLSGVGAPIWDRLILYDGLGATVHTLQLNRRPGCPVCSSAVLD